MRLIDVDAMNEELFYKELGGKDNLISAESVFDMLRATPTAYDVERVVEQLNDLPTFKVSATSEKHPFSSYEAEMISKHEVMGIVKKGGAE